MAEGRAKNGAKSGPEIGAGAQTVQETTSFLLTQTCKAYRRSIGEALSGLGLRTGQDQILLALLREDSQRLGELVERLNVAPPTLSRALDRMERDGLLRRSRDTDDARSFRVHLTEEGRALREPVEDCWRGIEHQTLSSLSPEEHLLFRRLLLRVHDDLRQKQRAEREGGEAAC